MSCKAPRGAALEEAKADVARIQLKKAKEERLKAEANMQEAREKRRLQQANKAAEGGPRLPVRPWN